MGKSIPEGTPPVAKDAPARTDSDAPHPVNDSPHFTDSRTAEERAADEKAAAAAAKDD
jgi:hypothetical protein